MEDFKIKNLEVLKAILHNSVQANVIALAQTELLLKVFSTSSEDYDNNLAFYLDAAKTAYSQTSENLFLLFGDLDLKDLLGDK